MDIQGILDNANKLVTYLDEKIPRDCDDEQKLQSIVEEVLKDTSLHYLRDAVVDVFVAYSIYIDLHIDEKVSICICTGDTDDNVYGYIRKHDSLFFVEGIRDDDKLVWRPNYRSGEYYSHEP